MHLIGHGLYNGVALPAIQLALRAASLSNAKVRRGLEGRKGLFPRLDAALQGLDERQPRIWIHSSSMGEFEQARPVIEALRRRYPQGLLVVSLFSPSAFDHVHHFKAADVLTYLPVDTPANVRRFLDAVKPQVALTVRHDFWPNHLYALNRRKIPSLLINGSVPYPPSLALRLFPLANRYLYGAFDEILTVSQEAADYARSHRWGRGEVAAVGDTRYDQVLRRAREAESVVAPLRAIKGRRAGLVLGSTWPADEAVVFEALTRIQTRGPLPFIVAAPHEPTEAHMTQLEHRAQALGLACRRLAQVEADPTAPVDMLIIDRVGILASLYALGETAYVGGGFGQGLHNVLEPAALGNAVLFGPRNQNSYEAQQLKRRGVGFACADADAVEARLSALFGDVHEQQVLGRRAAALVGEHAGATDRIVERVEAWLSPR